jgi:beta-N-acetylhexosaminidase
VDSIMTAHLAVPAFEPEQEPATVSHNILTGLLRDELGFKGIIVTDAMEMQAVAALYPSGEAAVRAIEAGADVVLMPTDPGACIRAIEAAVRSGRISRQRIDASAAKVLAAKQRTGLFRSRLVNLDAIPEGIQDDKLDALARSVAERAVTLVRDEKHLFPAPSLDGSCLVVLSESSFSTRGEVLARELARRMPTLKTFVTNPAMPAELLGAIANQTAQCKQIYAAAFITVAASRGSVDLEGGLDTFLKTLVRNPTPVALIAFGNPYLLRAVPGIGSYAATFSTAVTSETAAAKAILGEIPIGGKMPVAIPGLVKIGDGLNVPVKPNPASNPAD